MSGGGSLSRAAPSCAACRHFLDEAQALEEAIPGMAALSSAYGAVRGGNGICLPRGRWLAPAAHCGDFDERKG